MYPSRCCTGRCEHVFRASSKETNHAPNQRARTLAPARARKTKSCDRKTRAHLQARLVCARSGASRLPQRLAPDAPSRWFGCAKQLSPEALNVCDACRADTLGNRHPSRLLVNPARKMSGRERSSGRWSCGYCKQGLNAGPDRSKALSESRVLCAGRCNIPVPQH